MENKNKFEITAVTKPRIAQYLAKNQIVIAGEDGCSIVDCVKNEKVKQLNKINYADDYSRPKGLRVFPNEKKIFSFWGDTAVLYNAKSGQGEFFVAKKIIRGYACRPADNSIFLCYGDSQQLESYDNTITKYNYTTKISEDIVTSHRNVEIMALHPNGQEIVVGDSFGSFYVYQTNNLSLESKKIQLPEECFHYVQYSPDGSYVIYNDAIQTVVVNMKKDKQFFVRRDDYGNVGIAFLPNSLILSVLLKDRGKIDYWDIKEEKLIGMSDVDFLVLPSLSFSLDAKNGVVVTGDKCVIFPVPMKVFWHNKYPCLLFLLELIRKLIKKNRSF
jgi:hypothetical protein